MTLLKPLHYLGYAMRYEDGSVASHLFDLSSGELKHFGPYDIEGGVNDYVTYTEVAVIIADFKDGTLPISIEEFDVRIRAGEAWEHHEFNIFPRMQVIGLISIYNTDMQRNEELFRVFDRDKNDFYLTMYDKCIECMKQLEVDQRKTLEQPQTMKTTLYKLSKEGVMLTSVIFAEQKGDHWEIWKETGQKEGQKIIHSPDIIKEGKVKRTIEEQVKLQYDSIINKLKDKGYKETEQEAIDNRGTDASGVPKPMLAMPSKGKVIGFFLNSWLVSCKIDGGRCLIGKMNDEVVAISREGKDFSVSARFIIQELHENGILDRMDDGEFLDGELYIHGNSLQSISGLMRDQKEMDGHNELKYIVYDMVTDGPFKERVVVLGKLLQAAQLDRVVKLEHVPASNYDEIKALHDKYVADGYEGAIARDIDGEYLNGGRDKRMIKMKVFQDAEYKIIGFEEGKRGLVDLVYVMDAGKNGTFKAKPEGEEGCELKTVPQKFIGKTATIQFFNFTEKGVPSQAILKAIRDYE
jgi:hypothetical protein